METGEIRDLTNWDIRGFNILGDDGMPFITVEAKRINSSEPKYINVRIHLVDNDGNRRDVSEVILQKLSPHVKNTIEQLRSTVGNLPLQFFRCSPIHEAADTDWLT